MTDKLVKTLNSIDWDFKGAWTQEGIHGLHWYPGTFIPQIANNLIRLLTSRGESILDPFCGCGTALVESIKLGRTAIGIDSNPVGVLISKVKCSVFSTESLLHKLSLIRESTVGRLFEPQKHNDEFNTYEILSKWFSLNTLTCLLKLWDSINQHTDREEKNFFQICLSHVLKASSSQDKHWGWVADNVTPKKMKEKDIVKLFTRHCSKMIEAFDIFNHQIEMSDHTDINIVHNSTALKHDCRQNINFSKEIDAVITSPPYPSVIDYTKAHRLSYYLFGWDFDEDRQIEIGARWKRTRKKQLEQYKEEIILSFENINRVLKKGGLVGMVFDATKRQRNVLSNSSYVDIAGLLEEHFGYENISGYLTRKFSDQRFVDYQGKQNSEHIIVLKKP